ncbi:DNA methyltransferase [Brunnivagina elsteri]|uniref:site-specific DNA-methyltransferase (cytosine-N(4)-specific) n=1 Tax=Brunnivagina elsteri CCALA 953 TaxID=987040 RepID=A0A2A2TNL5_9CYAN|nr:DNA methyltransferase [Calothrix elsteri]PAX60101.1 DNA modification methylase [Calothrix elsteri CCALA 953]
MVKQFELPLKKILTSSSPSIDTASTFKDNMKLPVHRWFRYSAGFSAQWVEAIINQAQEMGRVTVLDPFVGSGTTLLASEKLRVESYGIEAHPFILRVAQAKLLYRTNTDTYLNFINKVIKVSQNLQARIDNYPKLIRECFKDEALEHLDKLRQAWEKLADDSPESQLAWLTLITILRPVSHAGTAPWQYILPNKRKQVSVEPMLAFKLMAETIAADITIASNTTNTFANLIQSDARTCEGIPDKFASLIVTSPPYANNYDYADATRLEMCFMQEISGWGDLQTTIRQYLVRSCSQHVTTKNVNIDEILESPALEPIKPAILEIYYRLSEERNFHGGKKNYHLMIACYFFDMAQVWQSLRRVSKSDSQVCFVIGDSAPYGIYVPVIEWMGLLAQAAGFKEFQFEKFRDRNIKWKNRKHQVPLCEGCLWIQG